MPTVPIRLDIFTALIFLGAIQGLLLSILFFRAREAKLSNRLFGFLILTITAFSIDTFLGYSRYMTRVIHFYDTTETLNFVLGPLIYLYVVVTLDHRKKLRRTDLFHFAPALIYAVYFLLYFLQTAEYKYNSYVDSHYPELPMLDAPARWHEDPLYLKKYINELHLLQVGIYIVLSFRYYRGWKQRHSSAGTPHPWIWGVLIVSTALYLVVVAVNIGFERGFGEYIPVTLSALVLYALTFKLISKSLFFTSSTSPRIPKYQKSPIPEDRVDASLDRLKTIMETEKPYLNPSFSLSMLAAKLNLSTHHVSQLLNGHMNQNFYEFTASYRVKAAQALLEHEETAMLPIEHIAERVGYYSKSSFNTAFKKHTGMTPSAFRKQAQNA